MTLVKISPEDLLAGADLTHDVAVPAAILNPGLHVEGSSNGFAVEKEAAIVTLRPLSIGAFQLILKAAKDDAGLIPLLMIKESLVEPQLNIQQIKRMHLGLVEFLVTQIRHISGLTEKKTF